MIYCRRTALCYAYCWGLSSTPPPWVQAAIAAGIITNVSVTQATVGKYHCGVGQWIVRDPMRGVKLVVYGDAYFKKHFVQVQG